MVADVVFCFFLDVFDGVVVGAVGWTAIGLWTAVKNLDYGLGCRLGFPPFLMDFVRGAVPDRGIEAWFDCTSVQSMRLMHSDASTSETPSQSALADGCE